MCFKIIKRVLGGLFGGGADDSTQEALDAARKAAETTATDEESVRRAQESRLKKLYAQRGEAKSFRGADTSRAPVAVRMLTGQ